MRVNVIHMSFLYSGGGERVVLEQARHLRERGHEVRVYAPIIRWDRCFPELLREIYPEHIIKPFPTPIFREASAMLMSALLPYGIRKLADCDILLCHSQPSMWIGYKINKLLGIPYVGYLHQLTTFIHKRPEIGENWASQSDFLLLEGLLGVFGRKVARHLDKMCHTNASRLIFNSVWTRKRFEQEYEVSGDVCYPSVNSSMLVAGNGERDETIITASRHYPWKRIDLGLRLLNMISHKPQFLVVGEYTNHTAHLKNVVRQLHLESQVNFTGFVTNTMLLRFLKRSLAYVQTSICEPFGLGPVESQCCGTPAVVWGDAGVAETVLDGETGFHAKPYDLRDYADKLESLLTPSDMWRRMSRDAKVWASSFSWDSHMDLLESVLADSIK